MVVAAAAAAAAADEVRLDLARLCCGRWSVVAAVAYGGDEISPKDVSE